MKITKQELTNQVKKLLGCVLSPLNGKSPLEFKSIINNEDAVIFAKREGKTVTKKLSYLRILIENLVEFPAINPALVLGISPASITELVVLLANSPNVGYFKDKSVTYLTLECGSHDAGTVLELMPGEASEVKGKTSKFESLDRKILLKELVNVYNTLSILAKESKDDSSEIKGMLKHLKGFKEQASQIFDSELSSEKENDEESDMEDQFEEFNESDYDLKFDPSQLDIKTKTPTIDLMMSRIRHSEIILNPDFQRNDRIWKEVDKSALIESILLKIPIPVFYMSAINDDEWLVVDGLQRLTTMYDFVNDKFRLKGLKILTQYNDTKFSQFPRSISRRIKETELVVHVIQPGSPRNATTEIFHRINTKGEKLSQQEIRSSLNVGYATKFLAKLAESKEFITATNDSVNPNRMQDIEYVLRFCAFYLESDHSNVNIKTMDKFLTNTMIWLNKEGKDSELVHKLEKNFYKAMRSARSLFDQFAFRKKYGLQVGNQINKALFETWSVGLAQLSETDLETLDLKKDQLISDFKQMILGKLVLADWKSDENKGKDFEFSISQSTSKTEMISYRYQSINSLIKRTINSDF